MNVKMKLKVILIALWGQGGAEGTRVRDVSGPE